MANFIRNLFNRDKTKIFATAAELNDRKKPLPPHIVLTGPGKCEGATWGTHFINDVIFAPRTVLEIEDENAGLSMTHIHANTLNIHWPAPYQHDYRPFGQRMLSMYHNDNNVKSLFVKNAHACHVTHANMVDFTASYCGEVRLTDERHLKSVNLFQVRHPKISDNPELEELSLDSVKNLEGFSAERNPKLKTSNALFKFIPIQYGYKQKYRDTLATVQCNELMVTDGHHYAYDTFHGMRHEMEHQIDRHYKENKTDAFFRRMSNGQYNALADVLKFSPYKKKPMP